MSTVNPTGAATASFWKPVDKEKLDDLITNHSVKIDKLDGLPEGVTLRVPDSWDTSPRTYEEQRDFWKPYFSVSEMYQNEGMYADYTTIKADAQALIGDYLDGNVSEEEFGEQFGDLLNQYMQACDDNGFPAIGTIFRNAMMEQSAMETFYSEFRRDFLSAAVKRNNMEGAAYCSGNPDTHNYKYYNSDYWYKSDAGITAITGKILSIAEEHGYDEFTIPDYKGKGLWQYHNFNTAFANPYNVDEKFFTDLDAVDKAPPEGLRWFWQQGGEKNKLSGVVTGIYENGRQVWDRGNAPFDPEDPTTATCWVSYRDADGSDHMVSRDICFTYEPQQLFNLTDLLKFSSRVPGADAVNGYMKNLQFFKIGHFGAQPPIKLNTRG